MSTQGLRTTPFPSYKEATDRLLKAPGLKDLAEATNASHQSVKQARLDEGATGHRSPPEGWAEGLGRLARKHVEELLELSDQLEKVAKIGPNGDWPPPDTRPASALTDDPTPVDDRVHEAEETEARIRREEARKREQLEAALERTEAELERLQAAADLTDPDVSPIQSAPGWRDEDYESVRRYESEDVRLAAGTGTFADQEPVAGEVKFRTSWLRKQRLRAKDVSLVDVSGDSMERTIFDGDAALVDETRCAPRSGWIYALRTDEGPVVKRLRKRKHRWWADSDNEEYEPQPLDDRARIMGRVVWWAHTDKG